MRLSQVPPSRQGVLHGAFNAIRTLVAVVTVPLGFRNFMSQNENFMDTI